MSLLSCWSVQATKWQPTKGRNKTGKERRSNCTTLSFRRCPWEGRSGSVRFVWMHFDYIFELHIISERPESYEIRLQFHPSIWLWPLELVVLCTLRAVCHLIGMPASYLAFKSHSSGAVSFMMTSLFLSQWGNSLPSQLLHPPPARQLVWLSLTSFLFHLRQQWYWMCSLTGS